LNELDLPIGNRLPVSAENMLETTLAEFFGPRLKPGHSLCVALSGGRDSVVMLHALCRLVSSSEMAIKLSALHVHHGISANADAWADFCVALCQQCAVPLEVIHVQVPRDRGEGLEAAARRKRHAVFANCAADWLVLAHHRDDQAETVLLNLLRGSGVVGAAGMLNERSQSHGPILVRPLLDEPRLEIENYASQHSLRWIDDESNNDRHFRRNFLRHDVMPRLEEKFPGAKKSLARAAGHFAKAGLLLDELAAIDRVALSSASGGGRLNLDGLNAFSHARAANLLRFVWLEAGFRAPDTLWIDEALKQLASADSLSEICLSTSDGELHVYRAELYLIKHYPPASAEPLLWSGENELPWSGGQVRFIQVTGSGFRRDLLDHGGLSLCSRQGGERLQPNQNRPRRTLRNLLQEQGVPPWERQRLPYLWCNGQLVWVGGLGVDTAFACASGEPGMMPVWENEGTIRMSERAGE